jgi:hypothetical protein
MLVIIQGSAEIYGHTLHGQGVIKDELWTTYSCFAPKGMPALSITALSDAQKKSPYEGNRTPISEAERNSLRGLVRISNKSTHKNNIIIGLLASHQNGARGFEGLSPNFKGLFPEALSAEAESLPGLEFVGVSEAPGPDVSVLQIPASWKSGVDCLSETKEQPHLVVCVLGAKNSGKSTCMRYTVNRLLNK